MLETLRAYGRDKLQESGEYPAVARQHRDWYLRLVKRAESEWISPQQTDWIIRLQQEQPNIRDAMEFCTSETGEAVVGLRMAVALYPFWFTRGLFSEGRRWLDRLLAADEAPTAERVQALYLSGEMAGLQGDIAAAIPLAVKARELAERLGDAEISAAVSYVEGNLALYSGDPAKAVTCFEHALSGLRPEANLVRRIEALVARGLASWLAGDVPLAIASNQEVLAIARDHGESVYRAYSLWALGLVSWRQGRSRAGVELLEEGVRIAHQVDDPVSGALCVEALSWIAAEDGQEDRAAVLMGAARALRKVVGGPTVHIPGMVDYHAQCERQTRKALGDGAYAAAFRNGQALNFDEATALALNESPPVHSTRRSAAGNDLTQRESQVAELVSEGLTNREIAARLVISPRTAQGHVENILVKLGFTSRAQIAAWFVEYNRQP
jgi:non-specific serine/threonine protein kinase